MLPKVKSRQIQRKGDHSRDRPFSYLLFTFNRSIFDNWKKFCSEIPPSPEILAHFEFIFFLECRSHLISLIPMLISIVNSSGFCVSRSGITLYIHVGEIALMTPPIAHILHLFCLLGAPNNFKCFNCGISCLLLSIYFFNISYAFKESFPVTT